MEPGIVLYASINVVELRRYTLRPGRRDDLIDLFEREFIESQEASGMLPIGHFRDLDDADGFVWLRGFENMESRRRALEAFYLRSDAWLKHRGEANSTMIDSDNVLLLRPARPSSGFRLTGLNRADPASRPARGSSFGVAVLMLDAHAGDELIASVEDELLPKLERDGQRAAYLVSEERANDFPSLPVREKEHALVIAGARSDRGESLWSDVLEHGNLPPSIRRHVLKCEILRLDPAGRSLLR